MTLVEGSKGVVAAWDTNGQIYFASVKPGTAEVTKPQSAPGAGKGRKHPVIAFNSRGDMILVWTEGTAWQRGGALAWQVFDSKGRPTQQKGRDDRGIPVWGLPAVMATEKGFAIIH